MICYKRIGIQECRIGKTFGFPIYNIYKNGKNII